LLRGASGVTEDPKRRAARSGLRKINIDSALKGAAVRRIGKRLAGEPGCDLLPSGNRTRWRVRPGCAFHGGFWSSRRSVREAGQSRRACIFLHMLFCIGMEKSQPARRQTSGPVSWSFAFCIFSSLNSLKYCEE
jgi:hypothetical protein